MIGIILAGGRSRRFGAPKWQARYEGSTFADRARATLAPVTASQWTVVPKGTSPVSNQLVDDVEFQGMGPLAGMVTVMRHVDSDWYAVSACDTPLLSSTVYERLLANREDKPVIAYADGRIHPLVGLYPRTMRLSFEDALNRGERAVMPHVFEATIVSFEEAAWFKNVNTPHDFKQLRQKEVE
ncbi:MULTISPECIES: molybdenum cofactor guanylyltransferase [Exiguobacterium]|uniref:molybdenum cofactor guanylyltransferase n=1 Tax=Exiguobacterium TaxID=33986 RepID=UPI001BEAD375|nr:MULTISPECIES: molybdenum cofactor guanylyltransferase [Exiguobacterium]MCT4783253.1 molybdenum cofactor guanylyltransferase [Exiguobacterium himgiriensis]